MITAGKLPIAIAFALVAAMALPAAAMMPPAAGGEPYEDRILPADVIVHIRTGPLGRSIDNIEALVARSAQGTPFMAMTQKGMIKARLMQLVPPGLLDMQGSAQFVVCNGGAAAFVMPIPGFAGKIGALKQAGFEIEETPDGVYKVTPPGKARMRAGPDGGIKKDVQPGPPHFSVDLGNGDVLTAGNLDHLKKVAAALKTPDKKRLPGKTSAALMVTVDIGKIVHLNRPMVEAGIAQARLELQNKAAGADVPAAAKSLANLAPAYMDKAKQLALDLKSMRTYLYADGKGLKLSGYLTPKMDTPMRKLALDYEPATPSYGLARYLPDNAVQVICLNIDATASKGVREFLSTAWGDVAGAVLGPQGRDAQQKLIADLMGLPAGETAMAALRDPTGAGQISVAYVAMRDADAYMRMVGQVGPPTEKAMNAGAAAFGLPVQFKSVYNANAGTAEGVRYCSFGWTVNPTEGADANHPVVSAVKRAMEQQTAYIGAVGNTVVSASGPKAPAHLAAAIRALKNKTPRMGAKQAFAEGLKGARSKQILFGSIYLLDFVKMTAEQSLAANPAAKAFMPVVAGLPKSNVPLTLSLGSVKGSLKYAIEIPAPAIQEAVVAGQAAAMQVMMIRMQQGGGGGMPPMPLP